MVLQTLSECYVEFVLCPNCGLETEYKIRNDAIYKCAACGTWSIWRTSCVYILAEGEGQEGTKAKEGTWKHNVMNIVGACD
jgi:predicted RNA-binding Zn-ribbon protein involved in translation (DUF1610 family)